MKNTKIRGQQPPKRIRVKTRPCVENVGELWKREEIRMWSESGNENGNKHKREERRGHGSDMSRSSYLGISTSA
jgi:hypothetical protein